MKKEAWELARKATVRSIVLLKNNGLLPLKKENIKSIAVVGPSADLVVSDWYSGTPPYQVSILDGLRNYAGDDITINYAADNKADAAVEAAGKSDAAIVCIGNHPLSYGLGWGENHVASDGREEIDRQAISLEQGGSCPPGEGSQSQHHPGHGFELPLCDSMVQGECPCYFTYYAIQSGTGQRHCRHPFRKGKSGRQTGADMVFFY